MATVARYIYSHYDPKDREALELATGQEPSGVVATNDAKKTEDIERAWQTEKSFGLERSLASAPRFVPAVVPYDEINNMMGIPRHLLDSPKAEEPTKEVASWYKALSRRRANAVPPEDSAEGSEVLPRARTNPRQSTPPSVSATEPSIAAPCPARKPGKNDWFITKVLQSEPSTNPPTPAPPPSLAEILARELPSTSQPPLKPPVFLALGPSNRGWTMLQQQGWEEGEGLGATAPRQADSQPSSARNVPISRKGKETERAIVKSEEREICLDADGEIREVRRVEVVDLTLSDSESESVAEDDADPSSQAQLPTSAPIDPHSTPLLTPIPTVLKTDRLGIGLKAKTVGPYKQSKKRVTHNQAALAAHIRETEEMRRIRALVGRGTRGFSRLSKADAEHRRRLLASLNSP